MVKVRDSAEAYFLDPLNHNIPLRDEQVFTKYSPIWGNTRLVSTHSTQSRCRKKLSKMKVKVLPFTKKYISSDCISYTQVSPVVFLLRLRRSYLWFCLTVVCLRQPFKLVPLFLLLAFSQSAHKVLTADTCPWKVVTNPSGQMQIVKFTSDCRSDLEV